MTISILNTVTRSSVLHVDRRLPYAPTVLVVRARGAVTELRQKVRQTMVTIRRSHIARTRARALTITVLNVMPARVRSVMMDTT